MTATYVDAQLQMTRLGRIALDCGFQNVRLVKDEATDTLGVEGLYGAERVRFASFEEFHAYRHKRGIPIVVTVPRG
jgi:hypothetical protein